MLKTSPTTSELKKRKDKANGSFVWSRITWLTWCCNRIPRVFFNIFTPSVTRLFGYQIEELLGKSAFDFLHPDERSVAINAFPDTLKKGQGVVEAPLLHKDGHYIRMDIIAKTFYTEKGEAQGIVMGWFAVLTVTDTEGGISPKDIGRIFEPFYTKRLWAKAGQASVWRLSGEPSRTIEGILICARKRTKEVHFLYIFR